MDEGEIQDQGADDLILTPTRNPLIGKKRPGSSGGPVRKQMMTTATLSTPPHPLRNQSSINHPRSNNDAPSGTTYQLVHINQPESAQRQQNVVRRIITTNGQDLVSTTGCQQIVLNSTGGLTFGTTAIQESPTPTRVTYVPANSISVASNSNNQSIQLQSFDNGGGQYYIMVPTGSEIIQSPSTPTVVSASATATPARVITTPIQPATFIPLSRLEPANTINVQAAPIAQAQAMKQHDFHGMESNVGTKEVKRRASHNEVEKRRRDKINNWISKLARVVPNSGGADFSNSTKTPQSKGGVLAKTVDYIQELRETNEQMVETVRHYDSVVKCLQDEIKQLRDIMQQAGIEAPPSVVNELAASTELLMNIDSARSNTIGAAQQTAESTIGATAPTSQSTSDNAAGTSAMLFKRKRGVGFGKRGFDNGDQSEHQTNDDDGSEDGRDEEDDEEETSGAD